MKDKKYTTIQIRKDLNDLVRKLCSEHGWIASAKTEHFWMTQISASMSGSISV